MDELLREYRETRSLLMGYKLICPEEEASLVGSMISDVQYCIDWLNKGFKPAPRRGIERSARERREVLLDPLKMQSYVQNQTAGAYNNITPWEHTQISEALSTLSGRERECYIMKYGQALSYEEVAHYMGIGKSTAASYVRRAQQKITNNLTSSLFLVNYA